LLLWLPEPEDLAARATRKRELRAESDRLAAKEERAARRLTALQLKLDAVTTELTALLKEQAPNLRGWTYRDNQKARADLNGLSERIRAAPPDYVAKFPNADAEWMRTALETFLTETFPNLFVEPTTNVIPFHHKDDADDY
jgi:hypothetical protein